MGGNGADLSRRVGAACDYYQSDDQRAHLVWYYDLLMSRLKVSDISTEELAGIVALLVNCHARKLAAADSTQPPGGVDPSVIEVGGMALSKRLALVPA